MVGLNRRLPQEIQRVSKGKWDVTICAPTRMQGDLSSLVLKEDEEDICRLVGVDVHMSQKIHFMFYSRRLKELCSEPFDLIHCWEEPYVICSAQIAHWSKRVPVIYYSFQNISKKYPWPFKAVEDFTMKRASGWIAAGNTVSTALLEKTSYNKLPNQIIPLGVDTKIFCPDKEKNLALRMSLGWAKNGPPVVGYLGRFTESKGLRLLTRVLDQCKSPWHAIFVGGGVLENELRAWASKYSNRVAVITGVSHQKVPCYLNAMDILVAPSQTTLNWREQLGRMLIESFACGVPVIASDSGEIPFVVGDSGVIVGEKDLDGWILALEKLLNSPDERKQLGQRGLERAHSYFTWPVIARQHCDFFDEIQGL